MKEDFVLLSQLCTDFEKVFVKDLPDKNYGRLLESVTKEVSRLQQFEAIVQRGRKVSVSSRVNTSQYSVDSAGRRKYSFLKDQLNIRLPSPSD